MSEPTFQELDKISTGAYVAGIMPTVEREIAEMAMVVQRKVFGAIRDGTLTPDMAVNAWYEVYSFQSLLRRLEKKVKVGQHVGERVADKLNIEEPR